MKAELEKQFTEGRESSVQPEISVIVPVYNVEEYLERCVKSIQGQTFSAFEIILVDDGSTDQSGRICDKMAETDARIHVIHKANGGLSDARNAGKKAASGQFLIFVDSDDFIREDALEILYKHATEKCADIVFGGVCNCYENWQEPAPDQVQTYECTGLEALKKAFLGDITITACGELIRADVCSTHDFQVGKTYEDAFFMPPLLLDVKKAVVTNVPLYYYWHRAGSITTKCDPEKAMDIVEAFQKAEKLIQERCPELLPYAYFRCHWGYFVALDRLFTVENYQQLPQYTACVKYLKKHWYAICKCPYFNKTRRIAAIALKLNIGLYKILSDMNRNKYGVYDK